MSRERDTKIISELLDLLIVELEAKYYKRLSKRQSPIDDENLVAEMVDKYIISNTSLTSDELDALLHGEIS